MNRFKIVDLVMTFSHEITAKKVIFKKGSKNEKTLLLELEEEINNIIYEKNKFYFSDIKSSPLEEFSIAWSKFINEQISSLNEKDKEVAVNIILKSIK